MVQNTLSALVACICLFINLVLSHPTAEITTALPTVGIKATGDATGALNTAVSAASDAAAKGVTAIEGAGKTAAQAATNGLNSATSAATTGLNAATSAATTGLNSATSAATTGLNLAAQVEANKIAAASSLTNSAMKIPLDLTTGLASGLTSGSGGLTTAFRNGANELINVADRGTGQLSSAFRSGATGGAGIFDGGLKVVGFQQPIATPLTDAALKIGEAGRTQSFNGLRQGVNTGFLIFDPLRLLFSGLGSGLGGASLSVAAQTPATATGSTTAAVTV